MPDRDRVTKLRLKLPSNGQTGEDGESSLLGHGRPHKVRTRTDARQVALPVLFAVNLLAARLPAGTPPAPVPRVAALAANALAPAAAAQVVPVSPKSPTTDCTPNRSLRDMATLAETLPRTSGELLELLSMCDNAVKMLISDGQFGYVHLAAMLAKDIAIALEGYVTGLTEQRRVQAMDAIRRLVFAAWKLIRYGDLGSREKLLETHDLFAAAIADTRTAYGVR
jgi:hypothetical protein